MTSIIKRHLIFLLALSFFLEVEPVSFVFSGKSNSEAQARVGRPATPMSYAGVARRTTRRVWRRTGAYYAALPAGCGRVTLYGAAVWNCAGVYYQPYGGQYVIVVVD
jgi:hypothetical protein